MEITSILWTAIELKVLHEYNQLPVDHVNNKLVFYICTEGTMSIASLAAAAKLLNTRLQTTILPKWKDDCNLYDMHKFLERNVDMIVIRSKHYRKLLELSKTSMIPMICVQSCRHASVAALADLMTIQLYYGRLNGLNHTLIGSSGQVVNSCLSIGAKLGINVTYRCSCDPTKGITPIVLKEAEACKYGKVKESLNIKDSLSGANVVTLCTSNKNNWGLKREDMSAAAPNWIVLQRYPRHSADMHEDFLDRNLMWESANNSKYVFAAMMLRFMSHYEHRTPRPDFENTHEFTR